jgi:hypothetical protein
MAKMQVESAPHGSVDSPKVHSFAREEKATCSERILRETLFQACYGILDKTLVNNNNL